MADLNKIRERLAAVKNKKYNAQIHTNSDTAALLKQSAALLRLTGQLEQLKQDVAALTEIRDGLLNDIETLQEMRSGCDGLILNIIKK